MARTLVSGNKGSVTLPSGSGANIASFQLALSQTVTDTTSYNDESFRTGVGENDVMAAGSAAGFLTHGTTNDQPGALTLLTPLGGALVLTADNGCLYSFTALFSDVVISHSRIGPITIVFNFRSTGSITETWNVAS